MPFDCDYPDVPIEDAARLTRDAVAASARERGLGAVYAVAAVETVSHRWRHRVVDVVVHMADGDDILGMQFPDEAHAAVTAAVQALLHSPREVTRAALRQAPAPAPPPAGASACPR